MKPVLFKKILVGLTISAEKIELSTDLDLIQEILFNEETPKEYKA